ncbi:MAG: hypothetical protein AAGA03_16210, partial [Planctomycetota bacterium]
MGILQALGLRTRSAAATVDTPRSASEPTTHREADPDLRTRSIRIDAADMNEESRSFPAILATEGRVLVYDYHSGRAIEEVLLAEGGSFPERMPLLDSHSRWSSRSVLGSVRNIRRDGDKWRGEPMVGRNLGDDVDQIWERIRQGHLTDGSIGYRYGDDDYVDIAPGQSASVAGRQWTAGKSTLRIVTKWSGREYSTTPIGADEAAKLNRSADLGLPKDEPARSQQSEGQANDPTEPVSNGPAPMKKSLKRFLIFLGLRSDATDAQAQSFRDALGGDQAERASRIESGSEEFTEGTASSNQGRSDQGSQAGTQQTTATQTTAEGTRTAEQIAQDAVRAERERIAFAEGYRGQLPDELIQRSINENWDQSRMQTNFLEHFRNHRDEPVVGTLGIHDGARANTATTAGLQMIALQRAGFEFSDERLQSPLMRHVLSDGESNARWLSDALGIQSRGGNLSEDQERALEFANRHSEMHMREVVGAAMQNEGVRFDPYDRMDMARYAVSSAAVGTIFSTHFAVQFMAGFMGVRDTTTGWTREADLPNMQKVERKQMGKGSPLKKRVKGETAKPITIDAIGEEYKLAEYTGQFFIDIQDAIDDRFNALDVTPAEMGEAAMEIRPDLVYAILLSNPNMVRDGNALFSVSAGGGRGNLHLNSPLSSANLSAAKTAMSTQKKGDRLIGVSPRGLIVPDSKEDVAWELVNSPDKRDNTDGKVYGTRNWAQGRFNVVPEPRLDVGVLDPDTETFVAGKPGSQFLTAEGGRHGIEVGFLQGTGRRPTIRRFV